MGEQKPQTEKIKFCKILEFEFNQVLVVKTFDDSESEEFPYKVIVSTQFEEANPTVEYGFDSEEEMNKDFDDHELVKAEQFISNIRKLIE